MDLTVWIPVIVAVLSLLSQVFRIWVGKEAKLSRTVDVLMEAIEHAPELLRAGEPSELLNAPGNTLFLSPVEQGQAPIVLAKLKRLVQMLADNAGVEDSILAPRAEKLSNGK